MVVDQFHPPKWRSVNLSGNVGESQNQPQGGSLPSLIAGPTDAIAEHAQSETSANPAADLHNRSLVAETTQIVQAFPALTGTMIARRADALGHIKRIAIRLEPERLDRAAKLPPKCPGRDMHILLIRHFAETSEYPDAAPTDDLNDGIPLMGRIQPTPGFAPRDKPSSDSVESRYAATQERNESVIDRARAWKSSALSASWAKTHAEADAGRSGN